MQKPMILSKLSGVRSCGDRKWTARCPAHDDRKPSLSVSVGDDGRVLLHCQAGCSFHEVCQALKIRPRDLFPAKRNETCARKNSRQVVATYPYRDEAGTLLFEVVRYEPKDFRQRRPNGRNGWVWNLNETPRVLYRLPELLATDRTECVFVCEGEKDVENVRALGLTATCNPGGAGKWACMRDDVALHGRRVVVVADKDPAGRQHAQDVAARLHDKTTCVKVMEMPGKGKDATDWIESLDSRTPEQLREVLLQLATEVASWEPSHAGAHEASGADPQGRAAHLTDLGNAERLVRRHGSDLRFCGGFGKWLRWDGVRWREDTDLHVMRLAKDVALSIFDEAKDEMGPRQKALSRWAVSSQFRERLSAMVDLARCELGVSPVSLDRDAFLLNVLNGSVDLHTGRLRDHRREDLITKLAPVVFDPTATCALWEAFLDRVMDGNPAMISYLRRIAGMCLTGDVSEQSLFLFYGAGANGKSVFLDTLCGLLGDYAAEAAPDLLVVRHSDEHPCEIADLAGRRLIVSSETEECVRLKVQLIKRLTGNARLKGRFMRQNYFEFLRTFKLILATNNKPRVREGSHAVWRRLRLIPFTVVIPDDEQDKNLTQRLMAEWPGILAWAVRGCLEWQREGLKAPDAVTVATATYQDEQDLLAEFVESHCILNPGAWTSRTEIFTAYQNWAQTAGERTPLDRTAFYERLRKLDGIADDTRRIHGTPTRGFSGIGLSGGGTRNEQL